MRGFRTLPWLRKRLKQRNANIVEVVQSKKEKKKNLFNL